VSASRTYTPLIALLTLIYFLTASDGQIIIPILSKICDTFGTTPNVAGLMVTSYSIAAAIIPLLVAPFADARGRRNFILLGTGFFATGLVLSYAAPTMTTLILTRSLVGIGAGLLSMLIQVYIGDVIPYERRGLVMGVVMSGYFAAMVLGIPLGSYIAEHAGWRMTFGTAAIAALILFVCLVFLLPRDAKTKKKPVRFRYDGLKQRGVIPLILIGFIDSGALMGFLIYMGIWLKETFQLTIVEISYLFIAVGLIALITSPFAGRAADRIGKKKMLMYSFGIRIVCFLSIPFFTESLIPVYIGFILLSLSAAFRMGPMNALVTHLVSEEQRASTIAAKNSMAQFGIGLGAWWCGFLLVKWSYLAVGISSSALALCCLILLIFKVRE